MVVFFFLSALAVALGALNQSLSVVAVLAALAIFAYQVLYLRSMTCSPTMTAFGSLAVSCPEQRHHRREKWRDIEDAVFFTGFVSWAFQLLFDPRRPSLHEGQRTNNCEREGRPQRCRPYQRSPPGQIGRFVPLKREKRKKETRMIRVFFRLLTGSARRPDSPCPAPGVVAALAPSRARRSGRQCRAGSAQARHAFVTTGGMVCTSRTMLRAICLSSGSPVASARAIWPYAFCVSFRAALILSCAGLARFLPVFTSASASCFLALVTRAYSWRLPCWNSASM